MEGLFFYSGVEQGVWNKRKDVQVAFPDPTGENFIAFKDWFLKNAIKEAMVDVSTYYTWHSIWKHNVNNHALFHREPNEGTDLGVNIVGWHGGRFSIGITATKLFAAATAVKLKTTAIQLPPPPDGKKFTHPSFLDYELTRTPSEAVNVVAVNADSTYYPMGSLTSIVWKNKYNIGFWAWELDSFPQKWVPELKKYDEIWCPSSFIKDAIKNAAGYDGTPVRVLNLPLLKKETTSNKKLADSLPFELEDKSLKVHPFTFLVVIDFKSIAERKNPIGAIKAFLDAFPAEEDSSGRYRLVVKAHHGTTAEMEELRTEARNDPRVIFIFRVLPDSENIALHNYQDCFVSLHRSEGYGLNILESLGAGIPVIATNYGGNVDFPKALPSQIERCYFPVPYMLVTLQKDYGVYEAGNRWAEPDHAYAVSAMRKVAANSCKQDHGLELSKLVTDSFGEVAVGKKMQTLLSEATPRILKKQKEVISFQTQFLERSLKNMPGWKSHPPVANKSDESWR